MPRRARLDAPGTLHHVMIRGIEGGKIFYQDGDREKFLSRIGELVPRTGTRILAWALMENHAHFLLLSGLAGISTFMRRLLTGYAVWFNRKYGRKGHLFQNRYKSIVCEEEPYLLEVVRYIHLNPLRASVVKDMLELDRYPWTGHSALIGKSKRDWQERRYVLDRFAEAEKKAIRAYRRFMEEGKGLGRQPRLVGGGLIRSLGGWSQVLSLRGKGGGVEHDERILGSGDFVQALMREADEKLERQIRSSGWGKSIEKVIRDICEEAGVKEEEVRRGSQRRKVSQVRGKIAHYLSREMGISLAEIARNLGVGISAIAMAVGKAEVGK